MTSEDGMNDFSGLEIAIIGMAGRFPGAASVTQFWRNLADGVEAIATFSDAEIRAAGVTAAEMAHPLYVKRGGVLAGAEEFDSAFFGIYPREADIMDPQQRIFLEVAWEALEHAGYNPEAYAGAIGVYAGTGMNTYLLYNLLANRWVRETVHGYQLGIASDKDYLPTRVSYKLNLRGPSVNVQTACSTSLVATHLACQGLLSYQCDMALAGGVTVRVPQTSGYLYLEGGIVSPDGYCRAFDAGAAGTVSGNGVGIVVLKRLADALVDGDTIHAVIKGSAINNDGSQKVGYTAPSVEGQAEVIAMAQSLADVDPETITYIEAHGTGTALGDPIEIAALTDVFRRTTELRQFCAIGSAKTNVGHLDAAAGVASLIKATLALQHRQIPPSLHYTAPNPQIDFPSTPFYVNTRLQAWEGGDGPRRAGVSSFGIGGTNAHVVLEEAPQLAPSSTSRAWQMLLLSARTPEALETATGNLAGFLAGNKDADLADVAYTLQVGRKPFRHRRVVVCRNVEEAQSVLNGQEATRTWNGVAPEGQPSVVFMLTGQGAQHANMGRGVYESEPVFRREVDLCCELLRPVLGLDLRELLYPEEADLEAAGQRLTQTAMAQPALFVIEYALARLWMSWGVRPEAMVGHSIGEYVAACLAGVMGLEDALVLVAERGRLMQGAASGAMLSVPLSEPELQRYLAEEPELALAALNGPGLSVLSGPEPVVQALAQRLAATGVESRRLLTSHAFHSGMMDPILEPFAATVRRVRLAPPQIPFVSNVTGTWITPQQATDPAYWARHLRQTVRFADGMATLAEDRSRVYLEVGPGRTLATLAKASLGAGAGPAVVHSMRHPAQGEAADDPGVLLAALGQLWLAGVTPEWEGFYGQEFRRRVPLPTYPFERQRHWVVPDTGWGDGTAARAELEKLPEVREWLYAPAWHRADLPGRPGPLPSGERWLVLAGDNALSAAVVRGLREAGLEVVVAEEPERTRTETHVPERTRTLQAQPQKGYQGERRQEGDAMDALVARVLAEGPVQRVVHLWGAGSVATGTQQERFTRAQALGFGSLVGLAQAWARHAAGTPVQIDVVTAGVQEVTGEEVVLPERATVQGLCLVLPQEQPEMSCRAIDLAVEALKDGGVAEGLAAQVLAELAMVPAEPVVALRGRHRWVQRFDRIQATAEPPDPLRPGGVYLITGGLGRIGFVLAEHLAANYQARLALIDRSVLPEAGQWQAWLKSHEEDDPASRKIRQLQALQAHGAEALVLHADVADRDAMARAVSQTLQRYGALHGVIHAAGLVGESALVPIADLAPRDWEEQFRAKAAGLQVLVEALEGHDLDFCLLQSSLAAILGGLGMAAYAAANCYMDALAHAKRGQGDNRWISVNWDGWRFDGDGPSSVDRAARLMALAIRPEEGVQAFRRVVALSGLAQVAVSTADLAARLAKHVKPGSRGEEEAEQRAEQTAGHARPTLRTAYEAPGTPLEQEVVALWEQILGISPVGVHDDFFELGGHSLLATQIVSRLRDSYSVELPLRTLFESPTVAGLAQLIQAGREMAQSPEYLVTSGGLVRIPREGVLPLSYGQHRLWFLDQLEPGSPLYNNFAALEVKGALQPGALEQALAAMVHRHEILRTVFREQDGQPVQIILDDMAVPVPVVDLRQLGTEETQQAEVTRLAAEEARQPFNLEKGPLLRARLLHLADDDHVLFFTMHHIVSDGWSVGVLVREVVALYENAVAGTALELPAMPVQYADWAVWQRGLLQGERRDLQLAYWRKQLANAAVLELPTDRPRPAMQTSRGANRWFEVPMGLYRQLETLGQVTGTTMFMTLLAAFQALLHRYTGQEDICVGSPIANRSRPETEGLIGFLLNTLVLRVGLEGDPTFRQLLGRVREVALSAYAHQDLPFEMLVEELQPRRDMSRSPFFQVMFDLQVAPLEAGAAVLGPGLQAVSLRPLPVDPGTAKFDLALSLIEPAPSGSSEETLSGYLNYNTDLFDEESIERLLGHFLTLLEGAVTDPDRRLSELPLLTAIEQAQIGTWSTAAAGKEPHCTVVEMFEAQVARTPEAVAVVMEGEDEQLSYQELNLRANQIAHALIAKGAGPERLAVLLVERSPDMIVAILAALKAGAAFVPLDPATPRDRLAFILGETGAVAVLTQRRLHASLGLANRADTICVDEELAEMAGADIGNPPVCVGTQNLAYVVYTSGSTGRPKGVLITQGAIAGHIVNMVQHFELTERDRVLQFAAYTFDQGLEQILAALVSGATLVMRGPDVWPAFDFMAVVRRHQLTVINLPPAYWNQVIQAASEVAAPQLRLIIVGGDVLAPEGLRLWAQSALRHARLLNAYGPTEATITATTYEVNRELVLAERQRPLPIGRPLPGRTAQVLDRYGNPVPSGVIGELVLGGAGLARGYLQHPELTAARFVPADGIIEDGARAYRTGDLVRWLPDGVLEFIGRTDQQVKIRGFRVELGEIEAVLGAHPAVRDAVVLVRDDGTDGTPAGWMGTDRRLVAYVVPARNRDLADVSPAELRAYLEEKLPAYMVPQAFLVLDALPVTASGKVNRRALPAPDAIQLQVETMYVGPRTPIEEDLVIMWRQVLGLERVGVHDNFFALGGHSLLATQILARLRESYPVELPLRRLFETPTVAGLAETIEEGLLGQEDEGELARLLAELEGLSDEEASRMLGSTGDGMDLEKME